MKVKRYIWRCLVAEKDVRRHSSEQDGYFLVAASNSCQATIPDKFPFACIRFCNAIEVQLDHGITVTWILILYQFVGGIGALNGASFKLIVVSFPPLAEILSRKESGKSHSTLMTVYICHENS
jgi:hypothetical protein